MRRNILTTIIISFSIAISTYADISVTEPSVSSFPDAKALSGDVNYKGHFNYSIDLMTVPGRNGLSFPLNLNYESNRILDSEATWVGWGWDLSCGYITRAVVNYPDEYPNEGFFAEGEEDVLIPDAAYPNRTQVFDCPDKFYLAMPGGGGAELVIAEPIRKGDGLLDDNGNPIGLSNQTLEFRCSQWNAWRIFGHIKPPSG
ncbi:MAG: hypothetical protein GY771_17130, partial [bacterium]|nr:hypothetical protein [bacterium]